MKKILLQVALLGAFIAGNAQTYQWANKIGDAEDQLSRKIHVDQASGKVFICGQFKGTVDFDPGAGTTNLTSGTAYNGYVASYTSAGALIWAKMLYSASGVSIIKSVVTDASLNVYLGGAIYNQVDMDPGAAVNNFTSGGQHYDAFFMKLDASGNFSYAKQIGTTSASVNGAVSDEVINDITLDASGNIYVVGSSEGLSLDLDPGTGTAIVTGSGDQLSGSGLNIIGYMVKFSNSGNYLGHYHQSSSPFELQYYFNKIKVDINNRIFVAGYLHDRDVIAPTTSDQYTSKIWVISPTFTLVRQQGFSKPQGNSTANYYENKATDIDFDAAGNYYVIGQFKSAVKIVHPTILTAGTSDYNGYVAKFASDGTGLWSKVISGTNTPTSLELDNSNNLIIGGYFSGTVDFDPSTATSLITATGASDGYILELNSNGDFTGNIQKLSGTENESIIDIAVQKSTGDFYITGNYETNNLDFNPNTGTNALANDGINDVFVAKYSHCDMPIPPVNTTLVGDLSVCTGGSTTLSVANQTGATFGWYVTATAGLQSSAGLTKNVSPTTTTSYFVQASNACGTSARTEIIVTAAGGPVTPTISASTTSPTTVCQGATLSFASSQTNGGTPTYQWNNNGSPISGATSSTFTTSTLTAGTHSITCTMTSTAPCRTTNNVTSTPIVVTVNPSVTPAISVVANQNNVCPNTNVVFTATVSNGGTSPMYQWKLNTTNQGAPTSNNTFSSSALTNGASITCAVTSNANCLTTPSALSSAVVLTVTPNVTPTITISTATTTVCGGSTVNFTSAITNGGTTPTYQWKLNGNNISGATSSTYSSSSLINGDIITCALTSNANCANPTTVTSNAKTMNVVSTVTPSVSISSNQTIICTGTNVVFTATPINGGTAPTYQWKLNGSNIGGATLATYSSSSLTNGASITCSIVSNNSCASPTTATSSPIVITVSGTVAPSVNISAISSTICQGDTLKLTATPSNGGSTPSYQWKKGGANISGATASTYTTTAAINGDSYTCVLTSSNACAAPTTATSNAIVSTINNSVLPTIIVFPNNNGFCSGTNIIFTANTTNAGSSPTYQWLVNGNPVGTNSSTFASSLFNNGDVVSCTLQSNAACASQSSVTSAGSSLSVLNVFTPSLTIAANPSAICSGDTLHLSVSALSDGGSNRVLNPATDNHQNITGGGGQFYQWKINGTNVGTNSPTFDAIGLNNGDLITCQFTSASPCASPQTVTSNTITATILSNIGNTVTISSAPATICAGDLATFNAAISGAANSTTYRWFLNGSEINGASSNSYQTFALSNNDNVSCIISSISACGSVVEDTSEITMTVGSPGQDAHIYITTSNTSICSTDTITFTSTSYNTGNNPVYEWLVNGVATGVDSTNFITGSLHNGDIVSCVLVSDDACLNTNRDTSSTITIGVTQTIIPQINLFASDSVICVGEAVSFNTTYNNEGSAPIFAWYLLNGSQNFLQVGQTTYSSSLLNNNDTIVAVLVNDDYCALPNFSMSTISISVGADTSVTSLNGTYTANLAGASYQWIDCNNGNQAIVGETNQSFTPSSNGSFAVIVNPGSCPDTSSCYTLNNIGLANNNGKSSIISIYPNPNNGEFTIQIDKTSNYKIVNLLGETIIEFELKSGIKNQVSLNNISNGIYYLIGANVNEKIVITK